LILRKVIKIVATSCHILKLKCPKFYYGGGSASAPSLELSRPTSWIKLLREDRGGRTGETGKGEKGGERTYF